MKEVRSYIPLLIPNSTMFLSSGCIMVLEVVATRMVARHIGTSIYTWTSVISVVLAGIALGNYLGGKAADKFAAKKTLGLLFAVASASCVGTIILNNLVGGWAWLKQFDLPWWAFLHVFIVYILPSILLGMVSPIAAKLAIDNGLSTGKTLGNIYAWGTAGGISGTLLTGFYLIPAMGTVAIVWMVGLVLSVMAVFYLKQSLIIYVWIIAFCLLSILGMSPETWTEKIGDIIALRTKHDPSLIFETESQYSYIAVNQLNAPLDIRRISQENPDASNTIIMKDITKLYSSYMQIWSMTVRQLSQNKKNFSTLVIGGGGYIFPRYLEKVYPASQIDVAEIDPAMTTASVEAFGLSKDTSINIIIMDARNYINQLIEKQRKGEAIPKYDFVFGDAYRDINVPFHLVTREFNESIANILADEGIYILNIIDVYDKGYFLGAMANTLKSVFPQLIIVSTIWRTDTCQNFVLIASKQKINLQKLFTNLGHKKGHLWVLTDAELSDLQAKANGVVLTDDYSPVENLLAPAALHIANYRRSQDIR